VVADTICNGARDYFPRTDEGGDPINALAIGISIRSIAPRRIERTRQEPLKEISQLDLVISEPMPKNSR